MKAVRVSFAAALAIYLLIALPASAHTLRTDGQISALLHIDPLDDPIAGQTSTILLEFSSSNPAFSLANCTCALTITTPGRAGVNLSVLPLSNDNLVSKQPYVFPVGADYTLTVSGQPKTGNSFAAFSLTYPVTAASPPNVHQTAYLRYGVYALIVAAIAGVLWVDYRRITLRGQSGEDQIDSKDHSEQS